MSPHHILMIDDDTELCQLMETYLSREGFRITTASDGESGLKAALEGAFNMILLDIMLPGMNGLDVLRELRHETAVPVLMLTAKGEDTDRIVGLEIGADDYLPKPFNPRELLARIRSILRRTQGNAPKTVTPGPAPIVLDKDIAMNIQGRRVERQGTDLSLTGVEFNLLDILVSARGEVVKREQLYIKVLDREYLPLDRSLDVHISNLRKKLGARGSRLIRAVRGEGYVFSGSIHSR